MNRMPTRNLPPSAEPWGRAVDNELATISRASEKQAQDTGNALSAINGTLTRLGEQVAEIRTIADTLVVQQATLEAQQAQLAQAVTDLQTVVNGMITPQRSGGGAANFSLATTYAVINTQSFTTPAGYTRALVLGISSTVAKNTNSVRDFLYSQVRIQGVFGTASFAGVETGNWGNVTAHATRLISGLAPGEVIVVETAARSAGAGWADPNYSTYMDSQVLFLR